MMKRFSIIAGVSKVCNGKLHWIVKEDFKHFRHFQHFQLITQTVDDSSKRNAVIMGRHKFESIGCKSLHGRLNICVSDTTDKGICDDLILCKSLDNAIAIASGFNDIEKIFVIGGETLYANAIKHPLCEEMFINEIDIVEKYDTFFPKIDSNVYTFYDQFTVCAGVICSYYRRAEFV